MSKLSRSVLNLAPVATLVALGLSIGCETAPAPAPAPAPPPPPPVADSTSGNNGGAEVGTEEMQVSVTGAEATQTGDTLKIEYPVLKEKNDRIPDWVINPGLGDVIGALGVAPQKGMGTKEQLDEAKLNGRIELAAMLEGRVQRVGRTELEEDYNATEAGRTEVSHKNILGVDRNILDMVLAGARQRALWFDPDNGEAYIWMVLDGAVLANASHHVADSVSVFVANTPITVPYIPQRRQQEVPQVIVAPRAPAPPPPEAPKDPIDVLEGKLKEIETIPLKKDGEGS